MTLLFLFACADKDPGDSGSPCTETAWFLDADGDGHGGADRVDACDAPAGYVAQSTDCDDADAQVNPDASERCDGLDNNCDGVTDDDATDVVSLFRDLDEDGFGDPNAVEDVCAGTAGYVDNGDDCDDASADAWPGADELCDGLDNDCDGAVDGDLWPGSSDDDLQGAIASTSSDLLCIEEGDFSSHHAYIDRDLTVRGFGDDQTRVGGIWVVGAEATVGDLAAEHAEFEDATATLTGVELSGLVVLNGSCDGCVLLSTDSQLTLDDVDVVDAELTLTNRIAGMVWLLDSQLTWTDGRIGDTTIAVDYRAARGYGLGLYASGSQLDLTDVTVSGIAYDAVGESTSTTVMMQVDGLVFLNGETHATFTNVSVVDNEVLQRATNTGGNGFASGNVFMVSSESSLDWIGGELSRNTFDAHATSQAAAYLMYATDSDVHVADVAIHDNDLDVYSNLYQSYVAGLYMNNRPHDLTRIDIRGNTWDSVGLSGWALGAIGGYEADGSQLNNVVVAGNTLTTDTNSYGLIASTRADTTATNLTVVGNTVNAYAADSGVFSVEWGALTVVNSAIHDNTLNADTQGRPGASVIAWDGRGEVVFDYNAVSDNTSNQADAYLRGNNAFDAFGEGTGNLDADPGFSSVSGDAADWDLTLASGSALIDAGDPSVEDPDGSACDIGAYGGVEAF